MSKFTRGIAVLAVLTVGTGAGIAQAQSQYDPPAPTPTPTPTPAPTPSPTTVLPTTVVKVLPTPQQRADKLVVAVSSAFKGISRKNLLSGTKITLAINGGGSAIVQLEVTKPGSRTYRQIGKLHLAANGSSKKTTLKLGKVGKSRLNAAAAKGKTFKLKLVVAIYSDRGTAKSTKTITVKG
ncbi:MAG: hypothetical protein AAGC46_05605 [Solirubrobacteraceae bacterium]|nr:hypothetical protein [Patulibacter sp.]